MKTVRKALWLLEMFSESKPDFGLTEIAAMAGLDKATTHRMLTALSDFGHVEQHPDTRRYRLGIAPLRLARIREACHPTLEIVRPVIESLSSETGETAHYSSMSGGRLTTLYFVESSRGNRVGMENADTLPLHATASGLAFLSHSPDQTVDAILSSALDRYTAKTPADPDEIRVRLEAARRNGYATSDEGFEEGVFGLAAPVFDWFGLPFATIGVASPVSRIDPEEIAAQSRRVRSAAREVTVALGGRHPDSLTRAS